MVEAEEQGFVQQLVPHLPVEAFAAAVLHRLARRNPDQLRRSPVAQPAPYGVKSVEALIAAG
jgi:hypothetical protein